MAPINNLRIFCDITCRDVFPPDRKQDGKTTNQTQDKSGNCPRNSQVTNQRTASASEKNEIKRMEKNSAASKSAEQFAKTFR
jgi:hypothetical protein